MTNIEISQTFADIAAMLRLKNDNVFKIRAYEKVSRSILELEEPVAALVAEDRIKEVPGAGEAITKKITELVNTGRLAFYEKLKAEFPQSQPSARA